VSTSTSTAEGCSTQEWFERAIATTPRHDQLRVDGAWIHYRAWGPAEAPGLLLVHGAGAHSGWWDHIAPQITGRRVVAIDLSGHGDSAPLSGYDVRQWAAEILAVSAAEELRRPVLVGHSMGGRAAVAAGVEREEAVSAVLLVDSPLAVHRNDRRHHERPAGPPRVYRTVDEAVARFAMRPREDRAVPFVRDHIARGSLRRVDGGWTWKSGREVFAVRPDLQDLLPRLTRPVALLRGQHGRVPPGMVADMAGLSGGPMPVVELPDAGHHPMVDRPLILVAALRALLAVWPSS
jgi:pimeloyl-ACP methyl ester carboxylesterase